MPGAGRLLLLLLALAIYSSHAFVLPILPSTLTKMNAANGANGAAAPESWTWIGGYKIDIIEQGAVMPTHDPDTLQPHREGAAPPPLGSPLERLWRIARIEGDGAVVGYAGLRAPGGDQPFVLADAGLRGEPVSRVILTALSPPEPLPLSLPVEMVDWVDHRGRSILPPGSRGIQRMTVHMFNVLHKGAGIFVRENESPNARVFCHQRASIKRIFPNMHDMFVGGVSHSGEPTEVTARRELQEELGFGRADAPFRFLFNCLVSTPMNRCVVDVYEYCIQPGEANNVRLDPDEVRWGGFVPLEEVKGRVVRNGRDGEWEFVPDGLQVWREMLAYWRREEAGLRGEMKV